MAEGRGRQAWGHTSAILALIANVNRDPKKTRPFKPSHFGSIVRKRYCPTTRTSTQLLPWRDGTKSFWLHDQMSMVV